MKTKTNLKIHVYAIDEGKKSFECYICLKVQKTKVNVKLYISAIHEGKKPFQNVVFVLIIFSKRPFENSHEENVIHPKYNVHIESIPDRD